MNESELSAVFHGVADESRRKILDILREGGELPVTDIAAAFSMSLNGVSKHLKILEKANLVKRRVEGRTHFMSVSMDGLNLGREWFHYQTNFWNKRLDQMSLILEQEGDSDE